MALYGAPMWVAALITQNKARLWWPQRILTVRAIRGYRTLSTEVACILAGKPLLDLEAELLAEDYQRAAKFQESTSKRCLIQCGLALGGI